jgi:Protein of unknown function (DUF2695)
MNKKHATTDKARLSTDSEGLGAWGSKIAGTVGHVPEEGESESFEKELRELEIILDHYGAECNCCGQIQKLFLTVDRINNDGYLYRRGGQGGFKLYRNIINDRFPNDIQILCFNCKLGRQKNGGMCPHKERRPGCVAVEPTASSGEVDRKGSKGVKLGTQIMTTGHPMWGHFAGLLATSLETRECDDTLTITRKLLLDMTIFDVDSSIEWLEDHTGFCDCEVLLNVDGVEWTDQ